MDEKTAVGKTLNRFESFFYGVGAFGRDIGGQTMLIFLMFFYTDVLGITPLAAGTLMMVIRIWDAVNDPLAALLIGRQRDAKPYRHYLNWWGLGQTIFLVLIFLVIPTKSYLIKLIWAYAVFFIYEWFSTGVIVSHMSLVSSMTRNPDERARTINMQSLFIGVASIVAVFADIFAGLFSSYSTGFTVIVAIMAVIGYGTLILSGVKCKQRIEAPQQDFSLRQIFGAILQNDAMLTVSVCVLFATMAGTFSAQNSFYFVRYVLGMPNMLPVIFIIVSVAGLLGNSIAPAIIKRLGKKMSLIVVQTFVALLQIVCFLTMSTDYMSEHVILIVSIITVATFFGTTIAVARDTMVTETVDYGQYKSGVRNEPLVYASFNFLRKLAPSLGGFLAGLVLTYTQYVPNAEVQPLLAKQGIAASMLIIPAVFNIFSVIAISFYKFTEDRYAEVVQELQEKQDDENSLGG